MSPIKGKRRDYIVSDTSQTADIRGNDIPIPEIFETYQPVLYIHKKLDYMRPERILAEAISSSDNIYLNYYVQWEDEIHPVPALHTIYRFYRSIHYGSPDDIEFIQIGVSKTTGEVNSVAFERDPSGRPNPVAPLHHAVICERDAGESDFRVTVNGRNTEPFHFEFEEKRLSILVATWNHIYDFYMGKGVRMDDPPVEPMTDDLYTKYFMSRRSRPPVR